MLSCRKWSSHCFDIESKIGSKNRVNTLPYSTQSFQMLPSFSIIRSIVLLRWTRGSSAAARPLRRSSYHLRVASLRIGVRRVAPGSQVLPDFEVISCPWRAASAARDQGSLSMPLLGKKSTDFSVRISLELRFSCFPEILLFRAKAVPFLKKVLPPPHFPPLGIFVFWAGEDLFIFGNTQRRWHPKKAQGEGAAAAGLDDQQAFRIQCVLKTDSAYPKDVGALAAHPRSQTRTTRSQPWSMRI